MESTEGRATIKTPRAQDQRARGGFFKRLIELHIVAIELCDLVDRGLPRVSAEIPEYLRVFSDTPELRPFFHAYRACVKIVYFRAFEREQKRGMGRDYKLAVIESRRTGNIFRQFFLMRGGQAVFRFVEQIQGVILYRTDEDTKRAFAV